jgi:hypothetical protein
LHRFPTQRGDLFVGRLNGLTKLRNCSFIGRDLPALK